MAESPEKIKAEILRLTREYTRLSHRANLPAQTPDSQRAEFRPGQDTVPYAGRVFDADEVEAAVSSTLDFWLTLGREGDAFEKELANFLGIKRSILVNSGSSANLLALSALTSPKLPEDRRIRPGDEVITVAAGFPTTAAPIIQTGAVPVFIDADPITLNARPEMLETAFVSGKTKAVIMAHTLGNPFDLAAVTEFCRRYNLWLIEDNCDALGSTYTLPPQPSGFSPQVSGFPPQPSGFSPQVSAFRFPLSASPPRLTGSFGDLSTQSFYPPHHLTLGEGGAVNVIHDMKLKVLVESFRDWGRDCWCASGVDNTCNQRFNWQLGDLPEGYDHKYIYSHLGYNLKPLDIQAAIGRAQMKKLPAFVEARRQNWETLRRGLADCCDFFDFQLPTHAKAWTPDGFIWEDGGHSSASPRCAPSWFGFMLMVKPGAPFTRTELSRHLDEKRIGNRTLFGGNLVRQPAFTQLLKGNPGAFRVIGDLCGADAIMNRVVFVGVYPGLTPAMLDYMIETIRDFCGRKGRKSGKRKPET